MDTKPPKEKIISRNILKSIEDCEDTTHQLEQPIQPNIADYLTSDKIVKVFVGPKRKEWFLHEELLCDRSYYFQAVFKGNFTEAKTKELYLDEDDPAAFSCFVNWVYGNMPACANPHTGQPKWEHTSVWCKLYVLADKFGIQGLMGQALGMYKTCMRGWYPEKADVEFVYKKTYEGSALRQFVMNEVSLSVMEVKFDMPWWTGVNGCNAPFISDFIQSLREHFAVDASDCELEECLVHHTLAGRELSFHQNA